MALDSSGVLDASDLTSDPLHTPNTPHDQLFNRNSLLMGHMRDAYMTPDMSLMVSASTIICALRSFFFLSAQNALSSPMEVRLRRTPEEQSLASVNTAYLQAQLVVERQIRKIAEMENQIRTLEMDNATLRIRFMDAQ